MYFFTFLPPGNYTLSLQSAGFKQYQDTDVRIQVAQVTRIDITMEIGSAKEVLDISGLSTDLNSENVSQGTVVGQEKISALPLNGRQFIQLVTSCPGVNPGGRTVQQNGIRQGQIGGISVAGGRTNNTMFLLDGAMNTDLDYSTLNYSPSIDGIAEFQVQTAMVGAEYARSTVNVVTKSGGNEFHGSAFEFLRNRNFDSRPFNLAHRGSRNISVTSLARRSADQSSRISFSRSFLTKDCAYVRPRRVDQCSGAHGRARNGDFSQSTPAGIFDPDSMANGVRQMFPGNKIPASRINPTCGRGDESCSVAGQCCHGTI